MEKKKKFEIQKSSFTHVRLIKIKRLKMIITIKTSKSHPNILTVP